MQPRELRRSGRELRLPLRRRHFKTLLSVRAKIADHSGGLEAAGVVLGMRRLGRKRAWHRHRGAFLVDAQAVMASMQKGRSSAPTLKHAARVAGAMSLACGWRWRFVYLPSESNPADDPSRGAKPVRRVRRTGRVRHSRAVIRSRDHCKSIVRTWRKCEYWMT